MTAPKSLDGSLDRFISGATERTWNTCATCAGSGNVASSSTRIWPGPPSGAFGPAVSATDCRSGHGLTGDADIDWQGDDDLGWARDDELGAPGPRPDST